MAKYVYYNDLGYIVRFLSCPEEFFKASEYPEYYLKFDGEEELEIDLEEHFVRAGTLRKKKEYTLLAYEANVTVGEDIVFTRIPYATIVTWPDNVTTNEYDGELSMPTTVVGEYKFIFDNVEYFPIEVVINVQA